MKPAPLFVEDIASSAFKRDPYRFFARLRSEAPVSRVKLRGLARGAPEAFLIARYGHAAAALKDPRLVKDPRNAQMRAPEPPALFRPLVRNMLALDDPHHTRLKRLVLAAFTPRRVARLVASTQAASSDLIERMSKRRSFDLIGDYAIRLPVIVISDLLGVAPEDRYRFARWSGALIRGASSAAAFALSLPHILAFTRYLDQLIAHKRATPENDLVSDLIAAEADGGKLDGEELTAMIALRLSAGHETTANLIGNGVLALLDNPDAALALKREPSLVESSVEEMLRFASPVAVSTNRYARENMSVADVEVPRGSLVLCLIASANRDECQFEGADKLNLTRSPNRRLTFGEGGHYCLGAALARMEGKIAFHDLLTRLPSLRLAVDRDALQWRPNLVLSGLARLPVAI